MAQQLQLLSLPPEIRKLIWEAVAYLDSQAVNAAIRSCQQILHEFLPLLFPLHPGEFAGGEYSYELIIAIEPNCISG
jgi:hypothetical protein